ncbi:hypothetical protein A2U01_0055772 [Trifolium medium]|uniref:Uncharacterized protein n=1 Tax=Trifolium medium TaxID=97028 RepID=A0A392REJ4_9FABA|nr:hypothetical protein [Trifolium medium]
MLVNGFHLSNEGFVIPLRNVWACEFRGETIVEDNDDTLEKCEVSLKRLEETDVSSAAATCAGYEEAQLWPTNRGHN